MRAFSSVFALFCVSEICGLGLRFQAASQLDAAVWDVDVDWGVLIGVHIGATWRIRLNRPTAKQRPNVI